MAASDEARSMPFPPAATGAVTLATMAARMRAPRKCSGVPFASAGSEALPEKEAPSQYFAYAMFQL